MSVRHELCRWQMGSPMSRLKPFYFCKQLVKLISGVYRRARSFSIFRHIWIPLYFYCLESASSTRKSVERARLSLTFSLPLYFPLSNNNGIYTMHEWGAQLYEGILAKFCLLLPMTLIVRGKSWSVEQQQQSCWRRTHHRNALMRSAYDPKLYDNTCNKNPMYGEWSLRNKQSHT